MEINLGTLILEKLIKSIFGLDRFNAELLYIVQPHNLIEMQLSEQEVIKGKKLGKLTEKWGIDP